MGHKIPTIENMRELAKLRQGKCLSEKYTNSFIKLKFECKEKHIWKTTPCSIKSGHWCPKCVYKNMWTIRRKNILLNNLINK